MQILTDLPAYDTLQRHLVRVIAEEVRDKLQEAAAGGASLDDAVEAITFGVTTIVDGIREIGCDGRPVVPVLMFGVLDAADQLTGVVSSGEGSRMHEHAVSAVQSLMRGVDAPEVAVAMAEEPAVPTTRTALVRLVRD